MAEEVVMMTIPEFIEKYCSDLKINTSNSADGVISDPMFTYDKIVNGHKVIYDSVGTEIWVLHIFEYTDKDFRYFYPKPESYAAYQRYKKRYKETRGEDLINKVRNQILQSMKRVSLFESYGGLD